MSKIPFFVLPFLILISPACLRQEKAPSTDVLSQQKMIEFLIDMHTVDALLHTEQNRPDEKQDMALYYYPSLLEKYGITRAQADSSFYWYSRRPKQFAKIYETVVSELEKRQIKEPVKDSVNEY